MLYNETPQQQSQVVTLGLSLPQQQSQVVTLSWAIPPSATIPSCYPQLGWAIPPSFPCIFLLYIVKPVLVLNIEKFEDSKGVVRSHRGQTTQ